jgi:rfaE bifunctional protein nucleotidyltransferase chain/domain
MNKTSKAGKTDRVTEKGECRKLYTLKEAAVLRKQLKKEGRELVFTNGCFDLVHPGHIQLLREAKAMGHFLLVGLNSDASVRRLKGESRPIMPQEARILLLCSMEMVDGVIVFEEDTPVPIIEILKPDCYVKGTGWQRDQMPEIGLVTGYGGRVALLESLSPLSTSQIIQKIRSLPADLL